MKALSYHFSTKKKKKKKRKEKREKKRSKYISILQLQRINSAWLKSHKHEYKIIA
jgi:hypothetical protein